MRCCKGWQALCFAVILSFPLASCATTGGMMDIAYANVGLQGPAEQLPVSQFDKQNASYQKAEQYYLRGRDKIFAKLDKKYPGFKEDILSGNADAISRAAGRLQSKDVGSAYWAGAGWLGAFSLNPMDRDLLSSIAGAPALLEKAAALEPEYSQGAIYDVLFAWYASAPPDLGGGQVRALECYQESIRISKGKSPGPYVTYAQSYCVPRQDLSGFEDALRKALNLKGGGLMGSRARKKARWLLEHKEDYFIIWDE
jgi:predicted anti-sigma-YlaC factor YlaD